MGLFSKKKEGKTAEEWFILGLDEKDQEKEIEYFSKCLELDPKNAVAWNYKGIVLYNLERHEEAIRCFDKALDIDPTDEVAWGIKGVALHNLEKYEEAIRCFDKTLDIDPKLASVWYNKGIALGKLERYEEAIRCFDKALDIDPKYTDAWKYKGVALHKLEKYEEEIRCFDKVLDIDPKCTDAWKCKGIALHKLEKYEEAIRCFDKALDIDPKSAAAWNNKGFALDDLEKYEEAIRCYDKALEINPDLEEAKNNKKLAEEKLKEQQAPGISPPPPKTDSHKPTTIPTPISYLSLERAIYDPCKHDFIEGQLPRMKEWIKRYDPGAYWFAVSIQNNTDRVIEEWGVELEFSSALKIEEAKIEGIEHENPHEAHLKSFKISVPREYGIVIPKGGTQRVYFKLRAEKPKTTYEISGIFKSEITGNVPIRAKEFKYLCDAGVSPEAVKAELKKTFSEKDAARLASAFRIAQDIRSGYCNNDTKAKDINKEFDVLKMYLNEREILDTVENVKRKINAELREDERLDEKHVEEVKDFCEKFTEMWIAKFLR